MKCQLELALTLVYKAIGVYSKLQFLLFELLSKCTHERTFKN